MRSFFAYEYPRYISCRLLKRFGLLLRLCEMTGSSSRQVPVRLYDYPSRDVVLSYGMIYENDNEYMNF